MTRAIYILVFTIFVNFLTQILKFSICVIKTKKVNFGILINSGGFPSTHAATATAMTMLVGSVSGFDSAVFAVSTTMLLIVMYDAIGVRNEAGKHARVLNHLLVDLKQHLTEEEKSQVLSNPLYSKRLKTRIGHTLPEVIGGFVFALVVVAFIITFFPFPG